SRSKPSRRQTGDVRRGYGVGVSIRTTARESGPHVDWGKTVWKRRHQSFPKSSGLKFDAVSIAVTQSLWCRSWWHDKTPKNRSKKRTSWLGPAFRFSDWPHGSEQFSCWSSAWGRHRPTTRLP